MSKLYVAYSSEDNGFRFPIGKPMKESSELEEWIEKVYIPENEKRALPIDKRMDLTEEEVNGSGPPDIACIGQVVVMYSLEGDPNVWEELKDENGDVCVTYDWIYIIKLEV